MSCSYSLLPQYLRPRRTWCLHTEQCWSTWPYRVWRQSMKPSGRVQDEGVDVLLRCHCWPRQQQEPCLPLMWLGVEENTMLMFHKTYWTSSNVYSTQRFVHVADRPRNNGESFWIDGLSLLIRALRTRLPFIGIHRGDSTTGMVSRNVRPLPLRADHLRGLL